MDIKIWYSKDVKQWRWSLHDQDFPVQKTGQHSSVRDAMNDIATVVEYEIKRKD